MTEKLTKRESKIADLFLEFLLTIDKSYAYKTTVYFFFNKEKLPGDRIIVICKYLERKNLIYIIFDNNEELKNIRFDKANILSFLKNDSVNKLWTSEKKLYNDSKLSQWQVKTFWIALSFGVFGGIYSGYDFIKSLTNEDTNQEKQVTKEQLESELSKLRILISDQKKDSLLIRPNSEKGK